jgi:ferritin-like metal-binding protein YciE
MKKVTDLKSFLRYETILLLDAETELQNYLVRLDSLVFSSELKEVIENYRKINIKQLIRIENLSRALNDRNDFIINNVMRELINNAKVLSELSDDPEVSDVMVVTSIQRINHYKIACYGALCAYADLLGLKSIAEDLHETLGEEKNVDKQLMALAKGKLNKDAAKPILEL